MARTFEEIVASLNALQAGDFDYKGPHYDSKDKLNELTAELIASPHPERGVPVLFDILERMPEADLGSPGPIVHTLERTRGHYEGELVASIKRRPTDLAIWMVNRILNATSDAESRVFYLGVLQTAAEHPSASQVVKQEAKRFIEHQSPPRK